MILAQNPYKQRPDLHLFNLNSFPKSKSTSDPRRDQSNCLKQRPQAGVYRGEEESVAVLRETKKTSLKGW